MTDLERFFRRLVSNLAATDPARLHRPLPLAEVRQSILPYRANRRSLQLDTSEEYELVLLRLSAGEEGLVRTEPEELRVRFAEELRSPNPDLDILQRHGDARITLRSEPLARALGPGPELAFAPPPAADTDFEEEPNLPLAVASMAPRAVASPRPTDIVAVIMGGGAGTRLFPLTKDRAKPAVPLAGKYRLVDIPISNCINSDLRRIFVLTQFQSSSLHRHIQESYRFDNFSPGFVEIMAAQQRSDRTDWYQGTADAVRQNLLHLNDYPHRLVLILSGDQLYRMDFWALIERHVASGAEVTVATTPMPAREAHAFGIMEVGGDERITRFVEKPKDPAVQAALSGYPDALPASMGIYVFNREVLAQALEGTEHDFGKGIIPRLIETRRVHAYRHEGYWEDIGTIRSFYEANLDLCEPVPKFNFYDATAPIFTHARYLPATKINKSRVERSVIADGCIINDAFIEHSLLGVRSRIEAGATIRDSLLMGADYYETPDRAKPEGAPPIGIGRGAWIERTIVDKNARIGDGVRVTPEGKPAEFNGPNFYLRDGLVIIPKGAVVMSGTVI
ncbi:MAG: glucose-1-phosphate adenylyltransferase [Gemmatimonadales bacterium]